MNKVTAFKLTAAILVALPLVGCGGGGSGSGSSGGSSSTSGLTSTTVYPSAGKFSAGTVVVVKSADGATTYGQGTVQGDGTAPVKLSGYSGGAVMLEVDGDGTGTYYDEAKAANVTFPKGAQLHAVATSASQQMAVSPLTEAAVQYIKNTGGSVTDTSAISAANGQIGAEFGLSDIVATPPTIVGSNADKVGIGTSTNGTNDKYALALAALAEAAAAKNNASANPALDAATDLTTGVSATNKTTLGLSSADLQAGVQAAQATYGDSNVQNLDLSSAIPTPATLPQPAAGVTWSDLDKAKHLFSDLRSDALTLVNDQKTGFFQVEGKAMADDMKASVKGHGAHFVDSDMAIMAGAQLSAMAVSGNLSGTTQWVDYQNVMHYDLNGCEVVGNSTTATCNVWVDYTYDPVTYSSTQTTIEIDVSPSSAASGSFTYTAQEKQDTYTNGSSAETLVGAATTGTITVSGTGSNGSVVINGNLPVADSTTQSAVLKNVTLSSSTNSSNQNTRALSGSYVYSENGTPVVTFSVLSGSQATVQVSTDANGNTYTEGVSGSLSLELKTAKFQYDGALNVGNFQKDKSGMDREPTHMDFAGTITDLNPDVGVVYTGKLALDATNFSAYDITQPTSSTNFQAGTVSYVGQVNPINRPPLKLTFSASQTTWDKVNMEVDYAYGDDHLTGTTVLTVNPNGPGAYDQTITITNSNNVKLVLTKPANGGTLTGTITVGGNTTAIATISGDQVNYTDGTFEAII